MRKSFMWVIPPLLMSAPPALAEPTPGVGMGTPEAKSARFQFTAGERWGGQPLVVPRPVYCSTQANVKFQSLPNTKQTRLLYGTVPVGDKQKMALVMARATTGPNAGQVRVYFDANGDKIITPQEGKLLQQGVAHWPACSEDLSARMSIGLSLSPHTGAAKTRPQRLVRSAVVWVCQAPHIVFFAWQGFLRGKLDIEGVQREAFLVDANSNGVFGDKSDQLWVDLNRDGKLDMAREEFGVTPILRVGKQIYRLSLTTQTPSLSNEVRLARLEGGLGKAKITMPSSPESSVRDLAATLISQIGDVASANGVGQEVEVPAGNYGISNLTLQVASKTEQPWKYSFSNWAETTDDKAYPLKIARDTTTDIVAFNNLTFDAKVEGERKPGADLRVTLSAKSELGLEMTKTERPGGDQYGRSEDYAQIELINPAGKTVATAATGFA